MKIYRPKLIELIFIFGIGIPIGLSLGYYNYKKIIFDVAIKPGVAMATNFCNSLDFKRQYLYDQADLQIDITLLGLSKKVFKILPSNEENIIKLSVNSDKFNIEKYKTELNILQKKINSSESSYFDQYYKDISLHCSSGVNYLVFKKIPGEILEINGSLRKRYNNTHLAIISLSPLLVLYLIIYLIRNYIINRINNRT